MSAELAENIKVLGKIGGENISYPTNTTIDISPFFGKSDTKDIGDIFGDGSCIHHWKLNSDVLDSVGTANGTIVGSVSHQVGTIRNGIKTVGGVNNWVSIPNFVPPLVMSLSCTIIETGLSSQAYAITFYYQDFITIKRVNGAVSFFATRQSDGTYIGGTSHAYPIGEPTQITLTRSSSYADLYINGEFLERINYDGTRTAALYKNTFLGYSAGTDVGGADEAVLEQVRMFNKELTQDEITTLYHESIAFKIPEKG